MSLWKWQSSHGKIREPFRFLMTDPSLGWWQAVGPYLDQALDVPVEERSRWLEELRKTQPTLASSLETLLASHERIADSRFLEHGAAVGLPSPSAGLTVGPYKLLAPLGEGGMGSVWLAERKDGEIQQQVAIKFLGSVHRRAWRDRFLRERQLLASLNHPSIVHVIDAGHTPDGGPYLVMEFVAGRPVDVAAAEMSLRDRLKLFLRICDAVSYAHRRLIIHRDLKPSNILVDESGQPKLLDFGIAKLLDPSSDLTGTIERMMTPGYASPEQVRGGVQTTATDIYSLGAVLHKLVTGRTVYHRDDAADAARGEQPMSRDFVPPSRLNPAVPVDLDYIVRKALREEPEERYATVEGLAGDIQALLDSRPVEARAGDLWYRTRKYARRHRYAVLAASLVIVSLSAGLYAVDRQRAIAERRFGQVRELANKLIAIEEEIRGLQGSIKARTRIVSESLSYLSALSEEVRGDRELAIELATAYIRVARVQGNPTSPNLGQLAEAEQSLQRAQALLAPVLAADANHRQALMLSATISHERMMLADVQRRRAESLEHAAAAAAQLESLTARGALAASDAYFAAQMLGNVGVAFQNNRKFTDSVRYGRQALAIADAFEPARRLRGSALGVLAFALFQLGDLDEALATANQSLAQVEKEAAGGNATMRGNLVNALWRRGRILGEGTGVSLGRKDEALADFQRALDVSEELAARDAADSLSRRNVAKVALQMGNILRHRGAATALTVYDKGLVRIREVKSNPAASRMEAELLASSSYPARWLERTDEARKRIDASFNLLRELKQYPADALEPVSEAGITLRALADHLAETGQPAEAAVRYEELIKMLTAWPGLRPGDDLRDGITMASMWGALADLYRRLGRPVDASALDSRSDELLKTWEKRLPDNAVLPPTRQIRSSPTE
jgi:tetratricopeptide (TPR) repeat protein